MAWNPVGGTVGVWGTGAVGTSHSILVQPKWELYPYSRHMFSAGIGLRQGFVTNSVCDSWTESQGAAEMRRVSGLGTSELHPCSLQTMWFCWLQQTVTPNTHWGSLQPSVKRLEWESAQNLRPWFSAGKRCCAPSGLGVSCCLKRRSSSNSGSCSRVRAKWSGRWTNGLVRLLQSCGRCTGPLWWRGSWAERRSARFTGSSTFKIADTSGQNEFPPQGGWAQP